MAEAPQTAEGWFVFHDFRTVDWDAWRNAPERTRETAIEDGISYLDAHEAVEDADEGASAIFTVLGHKADLLVMHLRPTLDALNRAERTFENTAFAEFTEQSHSYVSVTEVSGYVSDEYFEDPESVDEGLRQYIEGKLQPDIPDDTYVSFYPMAKRRTPEYNWYETPFDERADMMSEHGDTGREYAGKITQVISSSVGLDDWEWGVTLFGDDPTDIKDIVYEMRFDEVSSKYSEFGEFLVGRRFPPDDLDAFMAGEEVPVPESEKKHPPAHGEGGHGEGDHGEGGHPHAEGGEKTAEAEEREAGEESIREQLADLDVYAGQPHGEDVYALVLYSEADVDELKEETFDLRESFDHYDTHVKTAVYENPEGPNAVVSIWDTESAADTAGGFLSELPGIVGRAQEHTEGWGTMGMFYTTKPEYQEDFVEKFDAVGEALAEMEGHYETHLLQNVEDENDMFIASEWDSKEDAMDFFRSDAFRETVQWGRDVLADRPRHVFLA